ncbi:MAG: bacteriophage abortive infection AbiH family protein [Candidatus Sedimenticola sp. (ex Thyasira tokunagai)]
MNRLYIVGNGFDLYHGFKTRYIDFANYLKSVNKELLDLLYKYYFLECSEDLWSNFEESLANLDQESLLDDMGNYLPPSISSDDFRDRDWHSFSIEVNSKVGMLTNGLREEFRKFILNATSFVNFGEDGRLRLDPDAIYLSFNYSDTLESIYKIPGSRILYIHGKAKDSSNKIILGHGADPDQFKVKPQEVPMGLSDAEMERWYEYMSDQYDYAYEQGVEEIFSYFLESFKNSQQVIADNLEFFSKLKSVKDVYVLGHSLADVDQPYFHKLVDSVHSKCNWNMSYFGSEFQEKLSTLNSLGISSDDIRLIKLAEMLEK